MVHLILNFPKTARQSNILLKSVRDRVEVRTSAEQLGTARLQLEHPTRTAKMRELLLILMGKL
jgi:hypothetical protein